jgi:hypothetical protein
MQPEVLTRIKVRLALPMRPNFILVEGDRDDRASYDVADLDDEILREIGRQWTEALIAHARKRRSER